MEEELRSLWGKPIEQLPTFKDVGRLCQRIEVVHAGDSTLDEILDLYADRPEPVDPNHAKCLGHVVRRVALKLEPQNQKQTASLVAKFESDCGDQPDLEGPVKKMFSGFDQNGPTIRVFKMINQAVIAAAITPLKLKVVHRRSSLKQEETLTKDVRTSDGWRIVIKISTEEVCVTHIRKEQSLGKPMCPDIWTMTWRVDIHCPRDMSQLSRATLRVTDMAFGELIPEGMKRELARVFCVGEDFDASNDPPCEDPAVPPTGMGGGGGVTAGAGNQVGLRTGDGVGGGRGRRRSIWGHVRDYWSSIFHTTARASEEPPPLPPQPHQQR